MIPINLGQSAAQIGLAQALAQQPQQQRRVVGDPKAPQYGASARNYGLAEALQPIEVSSGTWGEALAEALAGGLRGRAAQSERQQAVDTEQWDRNQAEKTGAARNSAIAEALQGFDPANPQAMVGALSQGAPEEALGLATALAGREAPEVWSEPFEMNNMQVQRSSTSNQIRPIGNPPAAMIYQPPPGYRGTQESLEPIPGGPAALEQEQQAAAQIGRLETTDRQLTNSIDVLNNVLGFAAGNYNPDGSPVGDGQITDRTTGQWANRFREWGLNQAGENLYQALEPVVANIGFEALAEMRRNSATGGALGNVAVREIELLQRTVRSLATTQSPEQLRNNATAVRRQLVVVRNAIQAARQELQQMEGGAPSEPYVQDGQQERVLQWSPERGVY